MRGWPLPAALLLGALAAWWLASPSESASADAPARPAPANTPRAATPPLIASVPASAAAGTRSGLPLSPLNEAERSAQRTLWLGRLERAQEALSNYERAARYPHESRPIDEHPDQVRPFAPIAEERSLRVPHGTASANVKLLTTQERIFLSGAESSRITVTLQDSEGRTLPLRVNRSTLSEATAPGRTSSTTPVVVAINDAGQAGDAAAGDGIYTAWLQPAVQGFASYSGLVRFELWLEYAGQPGYLYFDLIYSPEQAARWLPGVREAVVAGSLEFKLKAEVLLPGRYVVNARIDDAEGQPFAITIFNAEVGTGVQEFKLPVFGKLIRDKQPSFPLQLRDVEAFLLKPDTYPDRVLMPRLAGVVHRSRSYALAAFADAQWNSAERERYLVELGRDVGQAKQELERLGP